MSEEACDGGINECESCQNQKLNASSFDFETGRGLEASRECGEAVVGRGNAEASVGVSAPTRESSGRPWPPGDPRGDARVRPRSHERVASHRARPSIPKAEKNKRENWRAGANLPRSGAVWCAFSPVHVRRSVQDVADGLVFLLLVERRRSVGRHCSPARSPASAGAALQSKKEPATFRATQISLSPTGPSRAYLSRCERFRRPSSCAPVDEGD